MLCCLSTFRSQPTTSWQLNSTPSIKLTTIRTYGSTGEVLRLAEQHAFQTQFGLLRQIARPWFLRRRRWQIASGRRGKIVRPSFLGRWPIGSGWLRQVVDSWFLDGRRRRGGID